MSQWSGLKIVCLNLVMVSALVFGSDRAFDQSSEIDFSKLQMTFREDFDDTLSVSPWGPNTRWIAHTPWAGDFGDASVSFEEPPEGLFLCRGDHDSCRPAWPGGWAVWPIFVCSGG